MANDVTTVQAPDLLGFIERASKDPEFDVGKFRELLLLYQQERDRQKKEAFNAAMADVQNEIGVIKRSGKNPSFNNPYAKLEDLDREARPIYTGHGFSIRYGSRLTVPDAPPLLPGHMRVVLTVSHRDGYTEEHHLDGPVDSQPGPRGRTPIQAVGSTVTYLRRYLLQMVLNLVPAGDPNDDDGEASRRAPSSSPPASSYREEVNRDIPIEHPPASPPRPNGNGNGNGRPGERRGPWQVWLASFEEALGKIEPGDQEGWDRLMARPTIEKAILQMDTAVAAEFDRIRAQHRARIFPEGVA